MKKPLRILVVEDSEDDALLMMRELRRAGFDPHFERVETPVAMEAALDRQDWDIILADYSLPAFDALTALALVKGKDLDLPFIIVSGVIGEETAVAAMRAGAHDYIMKGHLARLAPAVERELQEAKTRWERRRAEAALRESNELLERIFTGIHLAIAYLDKDLSFIRVNRTYAAADGRDPEFFVGKKHFDLYPNEENEAIFRRVAETGKPFSILAKPFVHPDHLERGVTHWDWSLQPIRDTEGRVSGLVLSLLDVTERRRLERLVLEISNTERQRIGQDLHDSLGQALTGIALLTGSLAQRLARQGSPEAGTALDISTLVKDAIGQARALAQGLCPVELSGEGLYAALRGLTENIIGVFGVPCTLACDGPVLVDDNMAAQHLYHIAQEAVTNAVRHGEPSQITIRLADRDGQLTMVIEDDGIGIRKESATDRGMGLRIMSHRAGMIGAVLQVRPNPKGGTIVKCTVATQHLVKGADRGSRNHGRKKGGAKRKREGKSPDR